MKKIFVASSSGDKDSLLPLHSAAPAGIDSPTAATAPERHYAFFTHTTCEMFPCHNIENEENFNCLFCYCPLYALGAACGGNFSYTSNGIKSCMDCCVPHIKSNYDMILDKLRLITKQVQQTGDEPVL